MIGVPPLGRVFDDMFDRMLQVTPRFVVLEGRHGGVACLEATPQSVATISRRTQKKMSAEEDTAMVGVEVPGRSDYRHPGAPHNVLLGIPVECLSARVSPAWIGLD